MADGPPEPRLIATDAGSTPRTPRWVLVFGIIGIVLVLLFVVIHLMGGGLHAHEMP